MKNLRKLLVSLVAAFFFLIVFSPLHVTASEKMAGSSAVFDRVSQSSYVVKADNRAKILQSYLEKYNSPFASNAKTFVTEADKNTIDWKLLPAIAGVESYFGHHIPSFSYNAWGYGIYGNNIRRFATWDEAIETISKAIRNDYMNNWGATNVYEIGNRYAADKAWAFKVTRYLNELSGFEEQYNNNALSISL